LGLGAPARWAGDSKLKRDATAEEQGQEPCEHAPSLPSIALHERLKVTQVQTRNRGWI